MDFGCFVGLRLALMKVLNTFGLNLDTNFLNSLLDAEVLNRCCLTPIVKIIILCAFGSCLIRSETLHFKIHAMTISLKLQKNKKQK